ncbi:unnamed protein product [Leuciscus chuanchicus]
MKGLVCLLLLLETFVFVVQHQVDGGLNENEISQQLRSEDGRQNPPQTDTLRDEASTDSQQNYHLCFTDIHAALRELTATVTEQKVNIRELTATVTEQKVNIRELTANIRALETRLREEMNKKNDEMSNLTLSQVEELRKENRDREIAFSAALLQSGDGYIGPFTTEITLTYRNVFTNIGNAYNPVTGVFTAPLKGAYMFRISVFSHGPTHAAASIYKNGERVVLAYARQPQRELNSSNGVVLILEVGDVVYTKKQYAKRGKYSVGLEDKPGHRIPKAGVFAEAGVGRAAAELSILEVEAKGPNASAGAEASSAGAGVMARAEVGSVSAKAGPVVAKLGLGVDTGASFGLGGLEAKFLGTGISIGPKTSVSLLGSEVSCSGM